MGKKILKTLFILFLILLCFTIGLIGYRASLVYKIYKARNKVLFESQNVKIEADYKITDLESNETWENSVIYRKGNVIKCNLTDTAEHIDDYDNLIRIYTGEKNFHSITKIDYMFAMTSYSYYPIIKLFYEEGYEKTFNDKLLELSIPVNLVLKGYPHIENRDGRELISVQQGDHILYFDKETGIFTQGYQLHADGTTELVQKFNVQFDVVTEEDVDYGDLSEYRFLTEE